MRTIIQLFAWLSLSATALSQNLVAYYPFNGNANDQSGNGINPTFIGSGVALSADRFGNANSAYYFDGATNSYMRMPADLLPTTNRTISIWFNVPDVTLRPALLGYGGDGNCGTTLLMGLNLIGSASYLVQGHCGNNNAAYAYPAAPVNNWYHWVLTINGSAQNIYINGQLKSTDNTFSGSTYVTGKDFALGVITYINGIAPYTDANVGYLNGKLDDIRIYDAALSDAQVLQLYKNESTGLVAYYPFNGNSNDESGNGYNGTVNGANLTTDRFGNANKAYNFTNPNHISVPNANMLGDEFTVSYWYKISSYFGQRAVMSNVAMPNGGFQQAFDGTAFSYILGYSFVGGYSPNYFYANYTMQESLSQWHHLAVTYKKLGTYSSVSKLYIDGVLKQSDSHLMPITYTPNTTFYIGQNHVGLNFEGDLDDIKIYSRILSPNEIAQLADIPFMPDLLAYLPMNGNANDMSGNNRNGTLYGGAALTTDKYNNNNSAYTITNPECGISLDNTNNLDFIGQPFAISAWVKYSNIPAADFAVVAKHNCGVPNGYLLSVNNNTPRFYLSTGGWSMISAPQSYNDNKWHNLVATYDGIGSQKLYVDGELKASASSVVYNNPSGSGAPIIIGDAAGNCGGGTFSATIDEVKIYDDALDGNQVTALYKQSRGSGNAINFDGIDDKINVGTGWDATNFTWEAWIKPDINNNNRNTIFSPEGNEGWYLQIQKVDNGGFVNRIYYGNGSDFLNIIQPYDGEWHHLAMTAQDVGSNFLLYKAYWDGVYATQFSVQRVNNSSTTNYYLGIRNYLNDMPFMGKMDEVRYWNTVLSQSQISQWMNRKVTPDHPAYNNLMHYYNFDEKAIFKTYDVRSANSSVLINGPVYVSSGASIGDNSNIITGMYNNPGATITLNSSTGENYTATMTSARNGGVAVYEILDIPENTSGILGLGSNNKYFGVFPIKGLFPPDFYIPPQYSLNYNYTGNPFVSSWTEPTLQLFKRTDNSASIWTNSGATLNTTANTLTVTGQNTEYILGSSGFGLPVTLLSFELKKLNATTAQLNWKTSQEINNKGFEVQRSFDGNYYTTIGFKNGAGNSDILKEYSFTDIPGITGRVYYRLKQTDFDGKNKFSSIESVLFDKQDIIKLYPNPARQFVMVEGISNYKRIQLLDATGRLLNDFINDNQYQMNIKLSGLVNGFYIIRLVNDNATQAIKIVIEN